LFIEGTVVKYGTDFVDIYRVSMSLF